MKKTSYLLLTGLLALTLISCGEENGTETSTTYTPRNAEIATPTVWKSTSVILIDCIVAVNSTLTIEPGCTVTFTNNGYLKVGEANNGAIIANGTADKPIRFTTALYTQAGSGTFTAQSGSWYGLYFGERNMVNTTSLRHCIFEGAGKNNTPCIELYKTTLDLESSIIRDCAGIGVKAGLLSSFKKFSYNELSRCGGFLLSGIPEALVELDKTNTLAPNNNKNIALMGGSIEFDCTLTKQTIPYTVLGNIYVENAVLTIEKGITLNFTNETSLNIGKEQRAALVAIGTAAEPIRLTSAASSPQAGDWQGLLFYEKNSSTQTHLKYVTIDYAGKAIGTAEGAIYTYSPIFVENSIIKNSQTYGIWCANGVTLTNFTNDTIQGCGKCPISINVNQAHTIDLNTIFTNNEYNYIQLKGSNLTSNATWRKLSLPYVLMDGLIIGYENALVKLTLSPGCTLEFPTGKSLTVGINGTLSAIGTLQDSITFTSASDTPQAGDWTGITFENGCSLGNNLCYCNVENAGDFLEFNIGINSSNVAITHPTIQNSLHHGIYIYYHEPANTPILRDNAFNGNLGDNIHYEIQPEQ